MKMLDYVLDKLSEWSIKAIIIFGLVLWIGIIVAVIYSVSTTEPEIEYTFHGHPIDVRELEDGEKQLK